MRQQIYWAGHIAMNAPVLAVRTVPLALSSRLSPRKGRPQILVGTHHKVLTVFLGRVFRAFAVITNRTWSMDLGSRLNYSCDMLVDHQSIIAWDKVRPDHVGLHVIRDPRDVIVSSMHYHKWSEEKWLHRPMERLGGRTYQDVLNALPSDEDRLLFEIEGQTGVTIQNMLDWDYNRPGIAECRYDQLVGEEAEANFAKVVAGWELPRQEHLLLVELFRYFSLGGPGKKTTHIRNPATGQWRKHFTPRVQAAFDQAFPGAIERLGFEPVLNAAADL